MADHGTNAGYTGGCKCDDCRAAHATYMREYTARNKERVSQQRSERWRAQSDERREARNTYLRGYMQKHPEQREKANERRRGYRSDSEYWQREKEQLYITWKRDPSKRALAYRKHLLKKKYGLTLEEFDEMLARQGNVCAICEREQVGMRLHIDHDHDTDKVRGLLCSNCNMALGLFGDNPDRLIAALAYLDA